VCTSLRRGCSKGESREKREQKNKGIAERRVTETEVLVGTQEYVSQSEIFGEELEQDSSGARSINGVMGTRRESVQEGCV
jgi:hypothetical protein